MPRQVRLQIVYQLVQDYGISLAEVGQQLGVSTSAISKAITRRTKE
jgi:biotin operon repressor